MYGCISKFESKFILIIKGNNIAGAFTNNQELLNKILKASE